MPSSQKYSISDLEKQVIIGFTIFGIIWTIFIIPYLMTNAQFLSLNPIFQYLIYNTGSIALITVFIGMPLEYFFKGTVTISGMIKDGLTSFVFFSLLFDLLQPPFLYDNMGRILTTEPSAITGASIEGVLGWIWGSLGVTGHNLYLFIYTVSPILAIIAIALILKPKEVIKLVTK